MRQKVENVKDVLKGLLGFIYDFYRFAKFTSTFEIKTPEQRSFRATKIYHMLEKSLSFRERKPYSGWAGAIQLSRLFTKSSLCQQPLGFQEQVAVKVLSDFVATTEPVEGVSEEVIGHLQSLPPPNPETPGGYDLLMASELASGKLEDPEAFFLSRRSVRDYAQIPVDPAIIRRAVALAMSAPSVCNRHAWHVYQVHDRALIDGSLSFQNGNRSFGHEVPCLLVIATDLQAFSTGAERYQHWIDGGIFAMNLVLSLHALGLSSCLLNWSTGPRRDIAFRKYFPISPSHSVITMLAVGYPNEQLKVCTSARRPVEEVLTFVDEPRLGE